MSEVWTHWRCSLHAVTGRLDDGSLRQHEHDEHGGNFITVLFHLGGGDE